VVGGGGDMAHSMPSGIGSSKNSPFAWPIVGDKRLGRREW